MTEKLDVEGNELLDLLENNGVLQEVNRTFFHPIGLNLKLKDNNQLSIEKTDDPKGFILDTIDKFKFKTFNEFRNNKHNIRQPFTGFVIQTQDMIRKEKLEVPLTPPNILKLQLLLAKIDEVAWEVKKKVMEVSKIKDNDLSNLNPEELVYFAQLDFQNGDTIDAVARIMMLHKISDINSKLEKIRKIAKDQKEYYK